MMNKPPLLQRLSQQEDLNFLLTNRIPRIALTRLMGWWSRIEHPWVFKASLWLWQRFSDLDLSEAKDPHFRSLQACFTRELKPGSRPIDARQEILCSPCDAIVGACGTVREGQVFQAKGFPYTLDSLLGSVQQSQHWQQVLEGGSFVTLRLTSSMYHRFHAPDACTLEHVSYISGDTWNVNPIALQRVQALFCKNERAVLHLRLHSGLPFLMVPVAAVLVASMRFHALNVLLHLRYKGAHEIACQAPYQRGQEMGWFEHGSTILLFVPPGFALAEGIESAQTIRMGQALMVKPNEPTV